LRLVGHWPVRLEDQVRSVCWRSQDVRSSPFSDVHCRCEQDHLHGLQHEASARRSRPESVIYADFNQSELDGSQPFVIRSVTRTNVELDPPAVIPEHITVSRRASSRGTLERSRSSVGPRCRTTWTSQPVTKSMSVVHRCRSAADQRSVHPSSLHSRGTRNSFLGRFRMLMNGWLVRSACGFLSTFALAGASGHRLPSGSLALLCGPVQRGGDSPATHAPFVAGNHLSSQCQGHSPPLPCT
jgi:hypothetical protein